MPPLEVSGWEVTQAAAGSRNYTVLTLEMLARENPGAVLYLAIGSDMLLSFEGWHRWQDILRLAHLVVTSRHMGDDPELHAGSGSAQIVQVSVMGRVKCTAVEKNFHFYFSRSA